MKTYKRLLSLGFILSAATTFSLPTAAAASELVFWNLANQSLHKQTGRSTRVGDLTGTLTYALGGMPVDWIIETPAASELPPPFTHSATTLTPANSHLTSSNPLSFRISSTAGNVDVTVSDSSRSSVFNQPGTMTPDVLLVYFDEFGGHGSGFVNLLDRTPITGTGVLAVPEPQTYAMMALGLAVLVLTRRRPRRYEPSPATSETSDATYRNR